MNSLARKIFALALVLVFVGNIVTPVAVNAGTSFGSFSKDTQKNFEDGVVMCAATFLVLQIISSIAGALNVPTNDPPNNIKEQILDCLFWAFKNALIQEVTGSTIQWVQTGMKGNPAFVQNIGQHLRKVADREVGKYIKNFAPFLCSPFKADIQLQLNQLYKNSSGRGPAGINGSSCTLSESVENIDAFLAGDFSAGGWAGWQSMFSNPQNNPYGAYFEARNELSMRISSATGQEEKKIDLGNGFFSKEVQTCYGSDADGFIQTIDPDDPPDYIVEMWCDEPQIVTPGAQVKNSLEKAFDVNLDQIATADEFDEIFSLLAAWLISDILTRDEGLAGYDPEDIDHELPPPPPGGDLDDSIPGDSEPAGPAGPSLCFEKNGTFLTPVEGGVETAGFSFGVPQNVSYDRVEVSVDVKNNGWWPDREGAPVMPIWFVRDGNKNMYGYVKIDAPGGATGRELMLAHGIGLSHAYKTRVRVRPVDFPEGSTYRFKEVYDAKNQKVTLTVTDLGSGKVVRTITSTPTVPGINTGNEKFRIGIGYSSTEANVHERPAYGWEHSNLKVSFISGTTIPSTCTTPGSFNDKPDRPGDDDDDDRNI